MSGRTEAAARRVARVWRTPGRRPDAHRRAMDELRAHWPLLADAVAELADAVDADRDALERSVGIVRPPDVSAPSLDALNAEADLVRDVRVHQALGRTVRRVELAPELWDLLATRPAPPELRGAALDRSPHVPVGTWRLVLDGPLP